MRIYKPVTVVFMCVCVWVVGVIVRLQSISGTNHSFHLTCKGAKWQRSLNTCIIICIHALCIHFARTFKLSDLNMVLLHILKCLIFFSFNLCGILFVLTLLFN